MIVLGLIALALLVLLTVVAVRWVRRRARPPELRGDWWTSFEREFRAYAAVHTPPRRRSSPRRIKPRPPKRRERPSDA